MNLQIVKRLWSTTVGWEDADQVGYSDWGMRGCLSSSCAVTLSSKELWYQVRHDSWRIIQLSWHDMTLTDNLTRASVQVLACVCVSWGGGGGGWMETFVWLSRVHAMTSSHTNMQVSLPLFSQLLSVGISSPARLLDLSPAHTTWQYWCLLFSSATLGAKVINQDGLASVSSSRELVCFCHSSPIYNIILYLR